MDCSDLITSKKQKNLRAIKIKLLRFKQREPSLKTFPFLLSEIPKFTCVLSGGIIIIIFSLR